MIRRDTLERIAQIKGLSIQNAEKDYFQELFLFNLYRIVGKEFVFKGGTCLYKIYKLNRFSEDLDFTVTKKIDIDRIMRSVLYSIQSLGIGVRIKEMNKFQNQINIRLAFLGPLYKGTTDTVLVLLLNLSSREKPALPPQREMVLPAYPDVPSFEVFVMHENEILAEKIHAILTRNKPRDVYDLWFLLKFKNQLPDQKLLRKKIGKSFDPSEFMGRLEQKRKDWEKELKRFILGTLPPFEQVKKEIAEKVKASE